MKQELQEIIINTFPEYFGLYNEPVEPGVPFAPIKFGIECGDGWYWLIHNLIDTIDRYLTDNKHLNIQPIQITQIKEKFGSLRFYYNGGDELIRGMVWLAESMSYYICEDCGTTDDIGHTEGWILTVCKNCANTNHSNLNFKPDSENIEPNKFFKFKMNSNENLEA